MKSDIIVEKKSDLSLDFEAEYYRLKNMYEETRKENEEMKLTIVNMAKKLHRD